MYAPAAPTRPPFSKPEPAPSWNERVGLEGLLKYLRHEPNAGELCEVVQAALLRI